MAKDKTVVAPAATGDATENTEDNAFAALVAELGPLTKALDEGDEKIRAAAEAGDADGEDEDEDEDEDEGERERPRKSKGKEKRDCAEGEEPFGKSFTVKLPDGSEAEAYDGTAMMKALHVENGKLRTELSQSAAAMKVLVGSVKHQGELIKSLQSTLERIGKEGSGRRSVVNVHEKPVGQQPTEPVITPEELMTKAMTALRDGKITGLEVTKLEGSLGRGFQPPADILAKIA